MKLEALPVLHADIHGKVQHYIKITNGVNVKFINVGVTTYNAVVELQNQEPINLPELPFEKNEPDHETETSPNTGPETNVQTGNSEEEKREGEKRVENGRHKRRP